MGQRALGNGLNCGLGSQGCNGPAAARRRAGIRPASSRPPPGGASFDSLPDSYVIFVCGHDPYGASIPVYDLERTCAQDPSVAVGDGSHWRVLNALAWREEHDEGLRNLLNYVLSGEASDGLTREIDAAVEGINSDPVRRRKVKGFMTQERNWATRMSVARKEALAEGEARTAELFVKLLAAGRQDDLERVATDASYRDSLMRELGIG